MIFFIILIISFISALFIFKNIIPNISNKKKSFYKIERKILAFLMLFSISSFIYYNIGDPFINIKELNSSRKKLKETEAQKNKDFVWRGLGPEGSPGGPIMPIGPHGGSWRWHHGATMKPPWSPRGPKGEL